MTRRLAIAAILAICLGGPILEMFDRWDQTLQDGNDTEANAVVAALCVGVALAIGTMGIAGRIRALGSTARRFVVASHTPSFAIAPLAIPAPTSSPPTVLRV